MAEENNKLDLKVGRNYQYSTGYEIAIDKAKYLGQAILPSLNMNFHVFSFIDCRLDLIEQVIEQTGEKHYLLGTEESIRLDTRSNTFTRTGLGHLVCHSEFSITHCFPLEDRKSLIKLLNSSEEKI